MGANGLVLTGASSADNLNRVETAKTAGVRRPILIGGGIDVANISAAMAVSDGVVVSSSLRLRSAHGRIPKDRSKDWRQNRIVPGGGAFQERDDSIDLACLLEELSKPTVRLQTPKRHLVRVRSPVPEWWNFGAPVRTKLRTPTSLKSLTKNNEDDTM